MPPEGRAGFAGAAACRSEEHTSELQSQSNLVCRLLLEKKKTTQRPSACSGGLSRLSSLVSSFVRKPSILFLPSTTPYLLLQSCVAAKASDCHFNDARH